MGERWGSGEADALTGPTATQWERARDAGCSKQLSGAYAMNRVRSRPERLLESRHLTSVEDSEPTSTDRSAFPAIYWAQMPPIVRQNRRP